MYLHRQLFVNEYILTVRESLVRKFNPERAINDFLIFVRLVLSIFFFAEYREKYRAFKHGNAEKSVARLSAGVPGKVSRVYFIMLHNKMYALFSSESSKSCTNFLRISAACELTELDNLKGGKDLEGIGEQFIYIFFFINSCIRLFAFCLIHLFRCF